MAIVKIRIEEVPPFPPNTGEQNMFDYATAGSSESRMKNTILVGDVLERLREIPDGIVQTVVTSPPYWGLRDYGVAGQLGLEKTPEEYVKKMVEVFREVRRVLRDDGTLWLNLGDSYANNGTGGQGLTGGRDKSTLQSPMSPLGTSPTKRTVPDGLKSKDLVGIPWRVALVLQADGWYLRSDIIWAKPNPMPESVTDRPTKSHEYIFLMTKSSRYYWDAEAVKEPVSPVSLARAEYGWDCDRDSTKNASMGGTGIHVEKMGSRFVNPSGRNKRTVWTIPTHSFKDAHFATFPEKLVEPCVKAGTSERGACSVCGTPWERIVEKLMPATRAVIAETPPGQTIQGGFSHERFDEPIITKTLGWQKACKCKTEKTRPCLVLDPFGGAGTVGVVAKRLRRDWTLIELNPAYAEMAERRIADTPAPML